jgi:hypothetical protein
MDALDRLIGPGGDLLDRVDSVLERAGAPPEHPVWPALRRLGVLPGPAVRAVAALRPGPPAAAEPSLRLLAQAYGDARVTMSRAVAWDGPGAEAFNAHREALGTYLAEGDESLSGRLAATAAYADAFGAWVARTRADLARTLAKVLQSAQAVAVVAGPARWGADETGTPAVVAAADIAARVLGTVAGAYDSAEELRREWEPRVAELPARPAGDPAPAPSATRLGR